MDEFPANSILVVLTRLVNFGTDGNLEASAGSDSVEDSSLIVGSESLASLAKTKQASAISTRRKFSLEDMAVLHYVYFVVQYIVGHNRVLTPREFLVCEESILRFDERPNYARCYRYYSLSSFMFCSDFYALISMHR